MPGDVLNLTLTLDRAAVPPGEKTRAHLIAVVEANDLEEQTRPPLSVVFALDTSGSMKGAPLQHVRQSVERIVSTLRPIDRVGVVTFSNSAERVLALRPVTDQTKRIARNVLERLEAGQMTHMEAGLLEALRLLEDRGPNDRPLVLLLSDGAPNVGRCTPLTLAEIAREHRGPTSIWTLGYGPSHQEDILAAVSQAAGGRYEYIPSPEVSEFFFAKVLGVQGQVVADGIQLAFAPESGCKLIRLVGQTGVHLDPRAPVLPLPDAFLRTRRAIVAEVELTAPEQSSAWHPIRARLQYRPTQGSGERTVEARVEVAISPASSREARPEPDVLLALADEARGEARALADRGQFAEASSTLEAMAKRLSEASAASPKLIPLKRAEDVLRDEHMAMSAAPSTDDYRAFRRSRISVSVSAAEYSGAIPSAPRSEYAKAVMREVAGDYPAAYLEHLSGPEAGRTHFLGGELIIGRGEGAQLRLESPRVQQQHARILAQAGRFYVMDLGTAHGTWLNDVRIDTHLLSPGDVIGIAEYELQYREGAPQGHELRLVVESENGERHPVDKTCLFVIGRSTACTLVIDSEWVGRQHAAIRHRDGEYWFEDYGSPGGSFRLSGEPIKAPIQIYDGDELSLGGHKIRFLFLP